MTKEQVIALMASNMVNQIVLQERGFNMAAELAISDAARLYDKVLEMAGNNYVVTPVEVLSLKEMLFGKKK